MIYHEIYNFCKVRNVGTIFENEIGTLPPRAQWLVTMLEELDIDFEIDEFPALGTSGWNIILRGTSSKWVSAHHDIVNPESDNANDNSCSVINAICLKLLKPEINVVILDGEEFGGLGARRMSNRMDMGDYGVVDYILNLELTGIGGRSFFVGQAGSDGVLGKRVADLFPDSGKEYVPFNDSLIFRMRGYDSIVINPLPILENGELDMDILMLCHSLEDSVDKISIEDMKEFTEEVLIPIVS